MMFKNPAFYKSLANQRYMRVRKINYLNLIVKTTETQKARSARVTKSVHYSLKGYPWSSFFIETTVQHKTFGT